MKPEEYGERLIDVNGWQVKLTTYRLGDIYHCSADNVSPGALIARTTGPTRAAAEQEALIVAERRLGRTQRREV
jgi:hypothetical protein